MIQAALRNDLKIELPHSQQSFSLKASTDKQEQCALWLSASATTLTLPG
jgi:hypothetical protein